MCNVCISLGNKQFCQYGCNQIFEEKKNRIPIKTKMRMKDALFSTQHKTKEKMTIL